MKAHEEYLRSVVPDDRLFFVNVKDGWEPLCKILDCPIPNEPFPYLNDKGEMKRGWAKTYRAGAARWLELFLTPFTVCADLLMCRRDRR
jgi:Sulfotransferase domain